MEHKDTKKEIKGKKRRSLEASKQLINTPLTEYMTTMMIKHVKYIAVVQVTGLRQLLLAYLFSNIVHWLKRERQLKEPHRHTDWILGRVD